MKMLHRKQVSDWVVRGRIDALAPEAGVSIPVGGVIEHPRRETSSPSLRDLPRRF